MSLCEALHGRQPWPELKLQGSSWELAGEGKEKGEKEGSRGRSLGGLGGRCRGGTMGEAAWSSGLPLRVRALCLLRAVCRKKRRKTKGEEKEKKGKEKEKKKKKMENFPNLKISEK
jgi:hypothetical protein